MRMWESSGEAKDVRALPACGQVRSPEITDHRHAQRFRQPAVLEENAFRQRAAAPLQQGGGRELTRQNDSMVHPLRAALLDQT